MDKVHVIPIARAKIAIKESELMGVLVKEPELLKTCLQRGKGIIRAEQQRTRIEKKLTEQS